MQTDPLIGRTFDEKYRIEERLGAGGMGAVYRATHLRLEKPVALKVMNPRLLESQEARARFLREARTAGRVQHPNAVTVTDYGETEDGHVYLVMDYLEGASLRQIILAEAPLDPARAVSLMLQVSAAVAAAHAAHVLHRDLKPSNIFIEQHKDAPPQVRLLDFGIAKLVQPEPDDDVLQHVTEGGAVMGTPRYMSPEQSDGEPLTPASDVYSLGIILYEMLAGEPPFSGNTMSLVIKHAVEPPRPLREIVPAVPLALEELTLHALAKNPANRPADAAAFRDQLFATAERLGLEHARADLQMALAYLKEEGVESPSGRFVIGIEKLREHRAANHQAGETEPPPVFASPVVLDVAPRAAATDEIRLRRTEPASVLSPVHAPAPEARPASDTARWRKGVILSATAVTVLGIGAGLMNMLRPAVVSQESVAQQITTTPATGLNNVVAERKETGQTRGATVTTAPPVSNKMPESVAPPARKTPSHGASAKRPSAVNSNQHAPFPVPTPAPTGQANRNGTPLPNAAATKTAKPSSNSNAKTAKDDRTKAPADSARRAKAAAKPLRTANNSNNNNASNGATRPRVINRRG